MKIQQSSVKVDRGVSRSRFIRGVALAFVGMLCFAGQLADLFAATVVYPSRPVRMIVPYAPGGGADTLARSVAHALTEQHGYSIVVDNRGGGGTILGSDIAAKALPDGYTIIMVASTHAVVSSLYKSLPYDPLKDFSPVIRVASAPNLLVLHPSLSVANVRELVAMARTQAGKLVYGSSGNGGGSHLAMELLKSLAKIDMLHVPYKGTGPAMIDLLSGQVKLMFGGMVGTLPTVKSGRLRAIAISSAKRSPVVPDVPTVAESGYPEYEATTWYGILAPTGTPSAVVKKLNGQIAASIQDSSLRKRITDQGGEPSSTTPEEFAAYIRSEVTKWAMVVKSSGARVD
jgi:tripartite-type tricarboxylate transporter receptor subunit TctC